MNNNQPRRRIDPNTFEAIRRALTELIAVLPPKWRGVGAAVLALLVALAVVFGWYETAPEAGYSATAILADGRDVNVVVRDGRGVIYPATFDKSGHGQMLRTTSDRLTHSVGVAPVLGWDLPYIGEIARGARGLRYCPDVGIQGHPDSLAQSIAAVQFVIDSLPGVKPSEQNCRIFDLQFGVTPETDCGSPQALGCAAHQGSFVRVTVRPTLPVEAQFWVMVHESLHALNLGHTGQYGGEGRAHSHTSCLGFMDIGVGGNNRPVDNPGGLPCTPDLEDGAGGYRWGFRPNAPTLTPTPTPTPTPTRVPTPSPTPTPPPSTGKAQVWFYRPDGAGNCTIGGEREWLVVTCDVNTPARYWHRFTPDGLQGAFEEERR